MGPGEVGDEFDEIAEEDKTDFRTVYDSVTVPTDSSMVIRTLETQALLIQVDGDDVRLSLNASDDPREVGGAVGVMVVPRSAFVEALVTIGVVRRGDIPDV